MSIAFDCGSLTTLGDAVGISIAKLLEVNFGIIAACLPIMKPLSSYIHSLYTGIPFERRRSSAKTPTIPSSSRSHGPWYRLRGSRSALFNHKSAIPAQQGFRPSGGSSWTPDRQFTWRKPSSSLPWRMTSTRPQQETNENDRELPIQGITKRVDFEVEDIPLPPRAKDNSKEEVALEEML
ncbi:MAG: hypothetical protein Q9222_003395 [Ikaeria aurantiellina]